MLHNVVINNLNSGVSGLLKRPQTPHKYSSKQVIEKHY